MEDSTKVVVGIPIIGLLLIALFYPLDLFIPEGFWPLIPDIFLHYPLMYFLNQITPGLFWLGFFTIGVIMLKVVVDS